MDTWDPSVFEFDPRPGDLESQANERVAVVRTSDRVVYRRCRRRWGWSSHLRGNLGPREFASPLWYGSGFHFALEDLHGHKNYSSAWDAFKAYANATIKASKRKTGMKLPVDLPELMHLGQQMLGYYENEWLIARDPLETYIYQGIPQVEVNARVEVPFDATRFGYDKVIYSLTFDRVIIDQYGNLWIVEYKTAKQIMTLHLPTDAQCSAYVWAGTHIYDKPVVGVIYQQHRKDYPEDPRLLSTGKLSVNKTALTTHRHYRQVMLNFFGTIEHAPKDNIDHLNWLASQDQPEGDKFIRRDKAFRNQRQCETEGQKIMLELEEMLNPNTPLYPNPSRDCVYMCPFNGSCVSLDDGSDWEHELELMMMTREAKYDGWREFLN